MNRNVSTTDDVLALMDGLFAPEADRWTAGGASWWDEFYADRSRPVPFFADKPDENLDAHLRQGRIAPGRSALGAGPYDLIYDSGCFHHLPPHRRISYLALLERCLAPGGHFALTCFAAGEGGMGSELPDAELYLTGGLHGGLAYTDDELRHVFSGLTEIELRRMNDEAPESPVFGEPFLWTALFRAPARS
ncbi:SAM-dependent methyltransferase [Streptomyces albus subsp. albus]|nr:SAM-dependent methyltransferase [Streptomyces albus subsp. albus]